jgi:hypothetical protein
MVHDALYVHDEHAIQIQKLPDWLQVSPASEVRIYNVRGALVRRLAGPPGPGYHSLEWDGLDVRGTRAPNGIYFVSVRVGGVFERTWRVTVVR